MARTVGRVDILVDFDGNKLPEQARAIAEKAGDRAGAGFNERFAARFSKIGQDLLPELDKTGRLGGDRISTAMENAIDRRLDGIAAKIANAFLSPNGLDNFSENFRRVDDAANDLRGDLELLHDSGSLNDKMWNRFGGTLNQWLGEARKAEHETDLLTESQINMRLNGLSPNIPEMNRLTKSTKDMGDEADKSNFKWKSLSHGLRQAILIVGAVAAGGQQIATLGSAAGAGLTIFGGAAVYAGTGLGVLVAGIAGLKSQLDDLNERDELLNVMPEDLSDAQLQRLDELQAKIAGFDPALGSVQNLINAFDGLGTSITNALIAGSGPALEAFTTNIVPTITTGLTGIATALGDAITNSLGTIDSTKLATFFDNVQDVMDDLITIIFNVGSALGGVFQAADPFVENFLGFLRDVTGQFDDWVNSIEGQNALAEWFENGETILSRFGDLLGEIGEMFGRLVTPESVANTTALIDSLIGMMPFIESILGFFGQLDLFGRIASILEIFGGLLMPILDLLAPIFDILLDLGEMLNVFLAPAFLLLQIVLAPIQLLFDAISYVVDAVSERFQEFMETLTPVREAISDAADRIFAALTPALDGLIDKLLSLLPSPEELARIINDEVVPAIDNFATWLIDTAIPAISDMIDWIGDLVVWLRDDLPGTIEDIGDFVNDIEFWTERFVRFLLGPIGAVMDLVDWINTLNGTPVTNTGGGGGGGGGGGQDQFQASGGINWRPTYSVTGEDGPEAIVPLDRDLSRVDPAVRWLSAIAQGKRAPEGASSGSGTIVESGAIQIIGVSDGMLAADAALDRLVSRVGS